MDDQATGAPGRDRADEPAGGTSESDRSGGHSPWLVLAIVLTASFMELIDITIVNVAIPSIQQELDSPYSTIEFVIAGYQLGFACTIITAARLGDIYGRKRLFLVGMGLFVAASLASGLATGIEMLVIARVAQGVASGIMFPQVLSLIQVVFEPARRGKAFAFFGAIVGLASIAGPLLGGLLIEWDLFGWGWRSIFLVNVPIGVGAFVVALVVVPESRAPERPGLDLVGTAVVTVGLFLLVYPLVEGRQLGWPWWTFAMLAAAGVVLASFAVYEVRRTSADRSPLVTMTLFRQRAFSAGNAVAVLFFAGLGAFFFVLILTLQVGYGFSALHAGVTVLPFAIGAAGASAASNVASSRLGARVLNVGSALLVVGMVLLLLLVRANRVDLSSWDLVAPLLLAGLGLGLVVAPLSDVVLAGVHGPETGSASGVLSASQRIGGSIGVALIGVIFFWAIGASAGPALAAVTPDLRSSLAQAGVPAPAVDQVVAGFERCFRARADDPAASTDPDACQQLRQQADEAGLPEHQRARVEAAVVGQAAPEALGRAFNGGLTRALVYEIVVYLAVFGVAFLVPGADRSDERAPAESVADEEGLPVASAP